MSTILFHHQDCLYHDTGPGHPEGPDRLRAVMHALDDEHFPDLERRDAPLATEEQLERAHPRSHVERVLSQIPSKGFVHIDPDTVVSPGTRLAALRSAGAGCAAVDAVFAGEAHNAFCAVRPPGHHAEASLPMGFCLFNNVAIGALHARETHGVERIAIVDFDVHHGNGTQDIFERDASVMYISAHQWPFYPGTGAERERGVGNIVNMALAEGAGSAEFRHAMTATGLPALRAFKPQLIMISAGFDAHYLDPLALLNLREDDFAWVTAALVEIAHEQCGGRIVSMLEGGYNLEGLAASASAHVKTLMAG